jgi:hypothetical protein
MALIRPSTMLLATAISAPALWDTFVRHSLDVPSAMGRFLVAVPVSALMLHGLRSVTASYARHRIANAPVRASDKETAPDP